jgi:hypothetical protein
MELRLYKEPYQEPFSVNRLRLLFEGSVEAGSEVRSRRDIYLYVWIEDRQTLSGFQAVLDEEFVLDYRSPAKLEFSRISGRPVKRSLSRPLNSRERKDFIACLSELSNPVFPDLIKNVESLAHGAALPGVCLTKAETKTLNKLARQSPGVPK